MNNPSQEQKAPQTQPLDPRVYLAAERTLLAWIRTGLSMMGFGFVVARFGLFLRELALERGDSPAKGSGLSLWAGTTLVVLGISVNLASVIKNWYLIRRLERDEPMRLHFFSLGTINAILIAIIGLAMIAYLFLKLD